MTDPLIGKKIGQYEIQALIGQGGMAAVYRAYQPGMKRDVALKVVASLVTYDSHFMPRFNREIEFIASLEHAHIVPVYDHGTTEDGIAYLVMRYLKGGNLAERIRQETPLTLDQINAILRQVAEALDYAHKRGIIHRDIKPSNVLMDEQGNVYLADFGLARLTEPEPGKKLTETGSFLGTPTYISPEQVQQTAIDQRSDLYSLGIVLYEMLAGRPPFVGESAFTIMRAQIDQIPPPVREFRPELPVSLEVVLSKALEKDRNDRYQTASAMVEAFSRAISGELATLPIERQPGQASVTLPRFPIKPKTTRIFGAGLVTLLLITALGIFAFRIPGGANTPTPSPMVQWATLDEQTRPKQGVPADLNFTNAELNAAKTSLNGSFIGMMACTLSTDYHASLARAVRTRAQALNLPVQVADSQADQFRQPAIINSFTAQGAKVIIVCELDDKAIAPALAAAQDAGVKIVRFSEVVSDRGSVTITFRNEDMGKAVGEYTAELINKEMNGHASVAILDYPPVPATVKRADAMQAALLEKAPNVKVVGRWQGGLPDDGERSMTDALAQYPEINVIMSINDAGAYGAVKALRKAGKQPGDVVIVSVDAETEARRMIASGEFFRASVDSGAVASGELAVDAAVKLLADAPVPRQIFLPGKVVTREDLAATAEATRAK